MASYKTTNTDSCATLKKEKVQETDNEKENGNGNLACGYSGRTRLVVGALLSLLVITVVVSTVFIVKALKSPTDEVDNANAKGQAQIPLRNQYFIEIPDAMNSIISGGEILLKCKVGNLAGQVQWIKNGVALGYEADLIKNQCDQCSLIGDPNQGEYYLLVKNIQQPATFECQVSPDAKTNQRGLKTSTHVTVQVVDSSWEDYDEYSGEDEIMAGRPLIVEGKSRTTHSEAHSMPEKHPQLWKSEESPSVSPRNAHNQEIGRQWLRHAEAEHASVASFARHTLQLMSIGAPSWILAASQQASLDEIKHTQICYGFASAFLGSVLRPGSLDVQGSLQSIDVKQILRSLIVEGCIGETLSAMEVHLAAQYATDTSVKAALEQIASDETKHSQLAWDTLVWILEKFPDTHNFVEETFKDELEEHLIPARNETFFQASILCRESDKDSAFHKSGLLVKADRDKVQQVGIKDIIGPVYQSGFKNVKMISKHITELDITVLIHGWESTGSPYCEG